jgi:DNA-binding response OmpR family regulator
MITVLVVDDEVEVLDYLCNFLKRFKIIVQRAKSGAEALHTFAESKAEWVLLDIKMPEVDGLEVLKQIKQIEPIANVIMITARDDKKSQERAMALGALDYVAKPLDLEELHEKIHTHILRDIKH